MFDPYEINRKVRAMTDAEISAAIKAVNSGECVEIDWGDVREYSVGVYPGGQKFYLPANTCQYCRSRFIADHRGNCGACGAPKGAG